MLRKELLASKHYGKHFRKLVNWANTFWQGYNRYAHYSHHDCRHSENIIKHLEEWLQHTNPKFKDAELFILLGAVYLHDIGMQCTDSQLLRDVAEISADERRLNLDEVALEKIRKAHARLSAEMICKAIRREDPEGTGLAALAVLFPSEYNAIALVAEGHTNKILADAVTDDYVGVPAVGSVRLKLLRYLLRIGDALDATGTRLDWSYWKPGYWEVANPTTRYHILRHQYVANITVSKGAKFKFNYTIPDNEKEHFEIISTCAEAPFRGELHNMRDYFQAHGILYMGNISSEMVPGPTFQFTMDEDTREVFTREAVEFHASTDRTFAKLVNGDKLKNRVELAVSWLAAQREVDGGWSRAQGQGSRIACTAKTIVALLDNKCFRNSNIRQHGEKVKEAFNWIMSQYDGSWGFPAESLVLETTNPIRKSFVHCTSMACYAYCLVRDAGLISDTEKQKYEEKIKASANWLDSIATGNAWGWGNFPGEPERALCGYWSIRALHRMSECSLCSFDCAGDMIRFAKYAENTNVAYGLAFSLILWRRVVLTLRTVKSCDSHASNFCATAIIYEKGSGLIFRNITDFME